MSAPKNVFWFEILLYAALTLDALYATLTLDALSVALQDRGALSVDIVIIATSLEGGLILVQLYFVWYLREGGWAGRAGRWPRCWRSLKFRFFRQLASRGCTS